MTRKKTVSDQEFILRAMPVISAGGSYAEIARATGMTIGGIRYRLAKLGLRVSRKYVPIEAIRVEE